MVDTIKKAIAANRCQPAVIVAHSWGVNNAMAAARLLQAEGICVDEIIAVDGVDRPPFPSPPGQDERFVNPGNVTRISNVKATGKDTGGIFGIDWNALVRAVGGGYERATGTRAPDARGPACTRPGDIGNAEVFDRTRGHVGVASGPKATVACTEAANRWKSAQTAKQAANCCGKCK